MYLNIIILHITVETVKMYKLLNMSRRTIFSVELYIYETSLCSAKGWDGDGNQGRYPDRYTICYCNSHILCLYYGYGGN